MRPSELNVRFVLYELDCKTTEDSGGDEPYLWVLGFKVDAETLGPPLTPPAHPLFPSLGVHIFEGPPHSRFIAGADTVVAPKKLPIPPAMGTREFRLKPANLPVAGWFSGIAGIICLLWDNDAFTADTRDDTYKAFRDEFGPALSDELNKLMNGGYDETLRRDANNQVVPGLEAMAVPQRLERLGNTEVRTRALKAMRDAIVPRIKGKIVDVVGISVDPDDILGTEAQVYLGNELVGAKDFSLRYTEDEADYTVRGQAFGQAIRIAKLESVVSKVERGDEQPHMARLWLQVCFHEPQEYVAYAFRQKITTRFELRNFAAEAPSAVRWFLDGKLLSPGEGAVSVNFEPVADYEGPPEDVLAPHYTGGPGTLRYRADGPVLDIWNDFANGVFFGEVKALFAYPGDPPLTDSLDSGYDRAADIGIAAINLIMNSEYREHVAECAKTVRDIDRNRIKAFVGKPSIDPGDPPPFREYMQERVTTAARVARAVNLQVLARLDKHEDIHMMINTQVKQRTCTDSATVSSHSQESNSRRASAYRLLDNAHSLRRALRFFASLANDPRDELDIVTLSRIRDRANRIARLLSEATKELKLFGVDKRSPFITETKGQKLSLQDASRAIRAIQINLMEVNAGDTFSSIANALGALRGIAETVGTGDVRPSNIPPQSNQPPLVIDLTKDNSSLWEALGNFFTFNGTEDDNARKFVSEQSCDGIRGLNDDDLVKLINAMLDGPTGDDDERGILKILDCLDCKRCGVIVGRVGLKNLLSDIDGEEWDRLVIRLLKCGIIGFDRMDDDASRQFVNSHDCSQLGALNLDSVRQLVLNMFSGSCGDDDENAILKLLRCQSKARLQQLVTMPGTDVSAFDYNFDGSEWDDLKAFFAANGITLDP